MKVVFAPSRTDEQRAVGRVSMADMSGARADASPADRRQSPKVGGPARVLTPPPFSPEVLGRHRAAVLAPQTAVQIAGQPRPLPAAYRLETLLVPEDLYMPATVEAMNAVLGRIGVVLDLPEAYDAPGPRVVTLRPRPGGAPTTVDAWLALQTMRAAAAAGNGPLGPKEIDRMSLDHLMTGSAFSASGGVQLSGVNMPTEGSGVDGVDAYGRAGSGGRMPVALGLHPAHRRDLPPGERRPVIVVLDSGTGNHPWLTPDVFTVRHSVQTAVIRASLAGAGPDGPVIDSASDGPAVDDPLVGALASHFGHGTFIAGILRQLAPGADIQMVRVMHSDGVAYESEVVTALATLVAEVGRLRDGDTSVAPVDIVSLSLGYFDESPDPATPAIAHLLGELTALGVTVVAAAGNSATTRPFLPAAFAAVLSGPDRAPMLAVGALNPNGTHALFTDEGSWVTCFATGASIVSTFPVSQGSEEAVSRVPRLHRESADPDDFTSGFAVWSGTSFAVPVVAGKLAEAMGRTTTASDTSTSWAVGHANAALTVVVGES